jgi:parallel beta-helix repeat protein
MFKNALLVALLLSCAVASAQTSIEPPAGSQINGVSGNGHGLVTTTGPGVAGDGGQWDANGNWVDSGSPAGAVATSTPASTYYVSNSGSDSNSGTSITTPWQTVSKINGWTFNPGDSVLFQSGGTWRELLVPPSSGSASGPVSFGSYGYGAQPEIDAGFLTTWTQGAGLPAQECANGTSVFCSGFETGGATFTDWTGGVTNNTNATVTQATAVVNRGSYAMRLLSTDGSDTRAFVSSATFTAMASGSNYGFRMYINPQASAIKASSNIKFMQTYASGSNNLACQLYTNASSVITQFSCYDFTDAVYIIPPTNISVAAGSWNQIEIDMTSSATAGGGKLLVNGTQVYVSPTFNLNTGAMIGTNSFDLGNHSFGALSAGGTIYFDDARVQASGLPVGGFNAGSAFAATVWRASQSTNPLFPNFATAPGIQESSLGSVVAPNEWYWDGSSFLYVYSVANPASTVEIPLRNYAIQVTGKAYLTFTNLDVRGAAIDGLHVTGASGNMRLLRNTFEFNWDSGSQYLENTAESDNVTIDQNVYRYNGGSGQDINSSYWTNWKITNNTVYSNAQITSTADSDHQFTAGLHSFCGIHSAGAGSIYSGNTAYGNGVSGSVGGQGRGIHVDTCTGVTVSNNTAYGNTGYGIFLEKNVNSTFIYNLAYGNASINFEANLAMKTSGEASWKNATGNVMSNNTSYGGGFWGIFVGAYEGSGTALFQNNVIENNIATGSPQANLWIDIGGNNDGTYGVGNIYRNNSLGPAAANFAYYCTTSGSACSGGSVSTYAALDTGYGSAMNNVQSNPLLSLPSAYDFSLQIGSPAIAAGFSDSSIPLILGTGSSLPDLGALPATGPASRGFTLATVDGQAATATPLIDGTGAVGNSLLYARQDHVHPTDTTRAPVASPAFTTQATSPLFTTSGTAPTIANGAAAGTSPGTPTVTGHNQSGVITLITGTATTAAATLATITFNGTLATAPQGCDLMPRNAAASAFTAFYTTAPTTTGFTVATGATAAPVSSTLVYSYQCL